MVAGCDTEYNKGDTALNIHTISLIPRTILYSTHMNATDTTAGGYAGCTMRTSDMQTIATKLRNALGDRLINRRVLLSNSVDNAKPSAGYSGWTGASNNWDWTSDYCTLMSEVQVYGSTVWSSSGYDVGEACSQLPFFSLFNHINYAKEGFWLRSVVSSTYFAYAGGIGHANYTGASVSGGVRPLIVIG